MNGVEWLNEILFRAEAVSTTSVNVQWVAPPLNDRNGVITGYRIKYRTRMRGTKGNTIVVDGSDQSFTITGLDPATQYMLRVAVVNQARFLLFLFFILMVFDDKTWF